MNLLTTDIDYIAERVKLRVMARGSACVYAGVRGKVVVLGAREKLCKAQSDGDLIGIYTRAATVSEIEDDLRARRREIAD